MSSDLAEIIVKDFLQHSWSSVEVLVKESRRFEETEKPAIRPLQFRNKGKSTVTSDNRHFFLRASVEYSNPQVTLEEVQGIMAARLLEVCSNYCLSYGLQQIDQKNIAEVYEMLAKPPQGLVKTFLLNTDDVEPDRYSANPLRESIAMSGQSAFPVATVKTSHLRTDENFVRKYNDVLISKDEVELIARCLEASGDSYVDMVDRVKYEQLESLSNSFGIDLCVDSMRLPIDLLGRETPQDLLHHVIKQVHADYDSVASAYNCMGRSMQSRTTLLTVPHSRKGYGSKRAVRGKMYFRERALKEVRVDYRTTQLYENEVDSHDISVAEADDSFTVEAEKLVNYSFKDTPSSPQFFLYALASPENAAIWHGIGVFGPPNLLKSYASVRLACTKDLFIKDLKNFGVRTDLPLNFNLVPRNMWSHPTHRNIDSSVGCVTNLKDLANMGMRVDHLPSP